MKKIHLIFLIPVLFAASCSKVDLQEPEVTETSEETASYLQEGVLRVKFDEKTVSRIENIGAEEFMKEIAGMGVYSMERLFPDAGEMEPRQRASGLHLWYKLYYKKGIVTGTKAVEAVSGMFEGAVVEQPRHIKPATIPFNDPYSSSQWNLYNPGTLAGSVRGVDINAAPVWEYTGGVPDVIVNVVDSGIDLNHPDLAGVVIPGGPDGSKNFVDGNYVISDNFHGTHVAGVIAAINNNGIGVSSIAGGLDGKGGVRILSSQIFKDDEETSKSAESDATAQAIVWGANHGALISQNSWGYEYESEEDAKKANNPKSIIEAIDYFIKYAGCDVNGNQVGLMKGGLVVFAAGNESWSIGHPADYEKVLAVGAVGPSGKRATYSNYGPWVDICAPGGDIEVFKKNEAMILSLGNGKTYYYAEGTSMACPHVSGVAALMISLFGGKGFTNDDLWKMLVGGANSSYGSSENIGPMLDADGSRQLYGKETAPKINASYHGDYVIRGHEILKVVYNISSISDKLTITVDPGEGAVAEIDDRSFTITYNDGSGKKKGSFKAKMKIVSASGLTTEEVIDYEILENHAPEVIKQYGDKTLRLSGSSFTIDCNTLFSDPDGGDLSYESTVAGTGAVSAKCSDGVVIVKFLNDGVDSVTITATDPCGESCSQSFLVGCYDDSKNGPASYPNPVTDILNICVGGSNETEVTLSSSTGVKLFNVTKTCSVLNPIQIDMTDYAAGRYKLVIKYEGKEYVKTIVKI